MEHNSRNIILMVALTLAIFLGYDYFYLAPQREAYEAALAEQQATADAAAANAGKQTATAGADTGLAPGEDLAPTSAAATQVPLTNTQVIDDAGFVTINTPSLQGRIALAGARFDSLELKKHTVTLEGSEPVRLLTPAGTGNGYYARFGWSAQNTSADMLPGETTVWHASSTTLTPNTPVTLSWTAPDGTLFETRISVDEDYLFEIKQSVQNSGEQTRNYAPYGLIYRAGIPDTNGLYILHEGPFGVFEGTFKEFSYDDFEDAPRFETASTGGWMGITDKYWMTALIPDQKAELSRALIQRSKNTTGGTGHQVSYVEGWTTVDPGTTFEDTTHFYAGAKEVDVIDTYADTYGIALFDRAIDWGWFYFLTRPIFFLLDFFNGLTGNFGVAIIILVLILKGSLYPLASRQYASMAHMKEAQPKIKALQERYKDDKAQLQQEMMKLYRSEKINPLAGCLPLLPQIFIFFALYKVLYVTIDMRHAPFFGWIQDLSAPDPLTPINLFGLLPFDPPSFLAVGVWPIFMGLAMWLQQRMSPTSLEPAQQRIMMMMPIIFTFILANFSAGLVVYWTLNSLLSVLQQWFITRRIEAKKTKKRQAA